MYIVEMLNQKCKLATLKMKKNNCQKKRLFERIIVAKKYNKIMIKLN